MRGRDTLYFPIFPLFVTCNRLYFANLFILAAPGAEKGARESFSIQDSIGEFIHLAEELYCIYIFGCTTTVCRCRHCHTWIFVAQEGYFSPH